MSRWPPYLLLAGLGCLPGVGRSQGRLIAGPEASPAHHLCWQEGRRLLWEDFRATTLPKSAPFIASHMGAVSDTYATYTPIITLQGVGTYQVECVFVRDSSWVNKQVIHTAAARAATLAHEQLHFDMAELVARRLRRRIAQGLLAHENLYATPATQDMERIYEEQDELGQQFHQEIKQAGGYLFEAPVCRRWQRRIAYELSQLAAYKSTDATCP